MASPPPLRLSSANKDNLVASPSPRSHHGRQAERPPLCTTHTRQREKINVQLFRPELKIFILGHREKNERGFVVSPPARIQRRYTCVRRKSTALSRPTKSVFIFFKVTLFPSQTFRQGHEVFQTRVEEPRMEMDGWSCCFAPISSCGRGCGTQLVRVRRCRRGGRSMYGIQRLRLKSLVRQVYAVHVQKSEEKRSFWFR